jgi:DNA sulfur modification protein DndB
LGTTLACLRGKMGTTDYYLVKMKAGTLINTVGYASQIAEWEDMDLDERMQRQLDDKRVVNEIVPYLIQDEDRFFGSIIVDVYQGWDQIQYESLSEMVKVPKAAYQNQSDEFGFVTLPDNQMLIALDGQHRLLALNVAIKGYRGLSGDTRMTEELKERLKPHPELVNEDLTVILVPHTDTMKIRKIFNKINRYAKGTSRGDNIVTDEDDIYAIIARRLIKPGQALGPINNQHVVNWTSNTLSQRSKNLTTISAVYSITEELIGKIDKKTRPDVHIIEQRTDEMSDIWNALLEGIDDFKAYTNILEGKSSIDVGQLREASLLLKPVTQMAIAIGYAEARKRKITLSTFVQKLNKIPWRYDSIIWQQVLVIPNTIKVLSGKQAVNNAGKIIAYMVAADQYSTKEKEDLLQDIRYMNSVYELPEPVE